MYFVYVSNIITTHNFQKELYNMFFCEEGSTCNYYIEPN